MQHDQEELNNLSRNVVRDYGNAGDADDILEELVQRAARHYAEHMEPITVDNQKPVRGPLHELAKADAEYL